jgi:hypothetical protein
MPGQVAGRGHHGHAQVGADRHPDHVARDQFTEADARIEAAGDDVHQQSFGDDLDRHAGIAA